MSVVCFQLFRRVAASLPGMEQTEQKKEDSILSFLPQSCPLPCMLTSSLCAVIAAWLNASSISATATCSDTYALRKDSLQRLLWIESCLSSHGYRPLSRRLDHCDRIIQNESRDSNIGNMYLFSAVTCTSHCKLRSLCANARLSTLLYTFREALASLSIAMAFRDKGLLA